MNRLPDPPPLDGEPDPPSGQPLIAAILLGLIVTGIAILLLARAAAPGLY